VAGVERVYSGVVSCGKVPLQQGEGWNSLLLGGLDGARLMCLMWLSMLNDSAFVECALG
jgi:hypothetical protein